MGKNKDEEEGRYGKRKRRGIMGEKNVGGEEKTTNRGRKTAEKGS